MMVQNEHHYNFGKETNKYKDFKWKNTKLLDSSFKLVSTIPHRLRVTPN